MNQTRSLLLIVWLFVAALLWMEWNKKPDASAANSVATNGTSAATAPALPEALPVASTASVLPGSPMSENTVSMAAEPITLQNDVLQLTLDLRSGDLVDSQLLTYTLEKKLGSAHVKLLNTEPARYFSAKAGLLRVDAQQHEQVLDANFRTEDGGNRYTLAPDAKALTVTLVSTDATTGLRIRRHLTLTRGSYVLSQKIEVSNLGNATQQVYPFVELARVAPPVPAKHKGLTNPEAFSFVGSAWYSPEEKFEKASFTDYAKLLPLNKSTADGWVAMLQHHFVAAWVPAAGEAQVFSLRTDGRAGVPLYHIRSVATPMAVAANTSQTRQSQLWVGPKLQAQMAQLAPSLKLSVDYGILTVLAQPLFWLLSQLYWLFNNWGWAIIAIVVLLKLALYPLSAAQYRSMAKMRSVQPRIEALKERYGDDRQQFQMAMMELYKKEKINPVGGCLPMLIPMPIFFALYWVLIETVELRHTSWMGWIQSLTDPDPLFILPILNLAVMYLTQKMTPTPGMDPMQKKMMQFMPLVFGVMMAFFPAGLVLYWVTNGALGLVQQQIMTKQNSAKANAVVGKS